MKFAAEIEVKGNGPAVLLLAGTAMDPSVWWPSVGACLVDAGFQAVVVCDRSRHYLRKRLGPLTVATMANDVVDLVEREGLAPVAAAGVSLGGFVTCELATRRPDLVSSAVLIASAGRPDPLAVSAARVPGFGIRHREGAADVRAQRAASAGWIADPTLDERWPRLAMPCLTIAFARDPLFPPNAVRAATARMPSGTYEEIAGARHDGVVTHGDAVGQAMLRFLPEPPGPGNAWPRPR